MTCLRPHGWSVSKGHAPLPGHLLPQLPLVLASPAICLCPDSSSPWSCSMSASQTLYSPQSGNVALLPTRAWHTVGAPQQCELKSTFFSADSSWETLLGTTQALYGFEISQRFSSLRRDKLPPHGVIPRTLRWDLAFSHVTAH